MTASEGMALIEMLEKSLGERHFEIGGQELCDGRLTRWIHETLPSRRRVRLRRRSHAAGELVHDALVFLGAAVADVV